MNFQWEVCFSNTSEFLNFHSGIFLRISGSRFSTANQHLTPKSVWTLGGGLDTDKSEMAIFQIFTMALGCLGEPAPSFTAFKLEELIQSPENGAMIGIAPAWKDIFEALGAGEGAMGPGKLEKMMMEVGVNDVGAFVDPMLKEELNTETVKEKIQQIAEDKEMLLKIVHGNPMVQQARFEYR